MRWSARRTMPGDGKPPPSGCSSRYERTADGQWGRSRSGDPKSSVPTTLRPWVTTKPHWPGSGPSRSRSLTASPRCLSRRNTSSASAIAAVSETTRFIRSDSSTALQTALWAPARALPVPAWAATASWSTRRTRGGIRVGADPKLCRLPQRPCSRQDTGIFTDLPGGTSTFTLIVRFWRPPRNCSPSISSSGSFPGLLTTRSGTEALSSSSMSRGALGPVAIGGSSFPIR